MCVVLFAKFQTWMDVFLYRLEKIKGVFKMVNLFLKKVSALLMVGIHLNALFVPAVRANDQQEEAHLQNILQSLPVAQAYTMQVHKKTDQKVVFKINNHVADITPETVSDFLFLTPLSSRGKKIGFRGVLKNLGTFSYFWKKGFLKFQGQEQDQKSVLNLVSNRGVHFQDMSLKNLIAKCQSLFFEGKNTAQKVVLWSYLKGKKKKLRAFELMTDASLTAQDLLIYGHFINKGLLSVRHKGFYNLSLRKGATFRNKGFVRTQGTVSASLFKDLASNSPQGKWFHEGNVELPSKSFIIRGNVSLAQGYLRGTPRQIINKNRFSLNQMTIANKNGKTPLFKIKNEGDLEISQKYRGNQAPTGVNFKIDNYKNLTMKTYREKGFSYHTRYQIFNYGKVVLENTKGFAYRLWNGYQAYIKIEEGHHTFSQFINYGTVDFENARHWSFGIHDQKNWNYIIMSTKVLQKKFKKNHVLWNGIDPKTGFGVYYDSQGHINVSGSLDFYVPGEIGKVHVRGDLKVGLSQLTLVDRDHPQNPKKNKKYTRTLSLLDDVTCDGKVTVHLEALNLEKELDLQRFKELVIKCTGAAKFFAMLITKRFKLYAKTLDMGKNNNSLKRTVRNPSIPMIKAMGALDMSTQGDLNVKYGCLYSLYDLTLQSKTKNITIGDFVPKKTQDLQTSFRGRIWKCRPYTTQWPNGSFVACLGSLSLRTNEKVLIAGALLRVQENLFVKGTSRDVRPKLFENMAGRIIVFKDANLSVEKIHNIRRRIGQAHFNAPPFRWDSYFMSEWHRVETSRAAQFHVKGNFTTNAPVFINNTSLVKISGSLNGYTPSSSSDFKKIPEKIKKGWKNITICLDGLRQRLVPMILAVKRERRYPPRKIEPHILASFNVAGAFVPPTLEHFQNTGVIEAEMMNLLVKGAVEVSRQRSSVQGPRVNDLSKQKLNPLLFQKTSTPGVPVIMPTVPLGSMAYQGPQVIVRMNPQTKGARLSITNRSEARPYFSASAFEYLLMTQIMPLLPQKYQKMGKEKLMLTLQGNMIEALKASKVLPSTTPNAFLENTTAPLLLVEVEDRDPEFMALVETMTDGEDYKYHDDGKMDVHSQKDLEATHQKAKRIIQKERSRALMQKNRDVRVQEKSLILKNAHHLLTTKNITRPLLVYVEKDIDGEPTLIPFVITPAKKQETGTMRTIKDMHIVSMNMKNRGATYVSSEGTITHHTFGNMISLPFAKTTTQQLDACTTLTRVRNLPTTYRAKNNITLTSGGVQVHVASDIATQDKEKGSIDLSGHTVQLRAAQDSDTTETHWTRSRTFGSKEYHCTTSQTKTKRTKIDSGTVTIRATQGDVISEAPEITAKKLVLTSDEGKVLIKHALEYFQRHVRKTNNDWAWNKTKLYGTSSVTPVDGIYTVKDIQIKAKKGIEGRFSQTIDEKDLMHAYLQDLKEKHPEQADIIIKYIQEKHDSYSECHESIGGPLALIITAIVTYVTMGAGLTLVKPLIATLAIQNTLAATMLVAAANAAVSSMAAQSAVSLISNKGKIDKVFKEMTTSKALKSLMLKMIVAASVVGMCDGFDIPSSTEVSMLNKEVGETIVTQSLSEKIGEALLRVGTQTTVDTAFHNVKFEEAFTNALKSGVANVAGDYFANKIGIAYKGTDIGYVERMLLHTGVGAGIGALQGDALAGGVGALVGELTGDAYKGLIGEDALRGDNANLWTETGVLTSQFAASMFAYSQGWDENIAANTAEKAVRYNSLSVILLTILAYETYQALQITTDGLYALASGDKEKQEIVTQRSKEFVIGQAIGLGTAGLGKGLFTLAKPYIPFVSPYVSKYFTTPLIRSLGGVKDSLNGLISKAVTAMRPTLKRFGQTKIPFGNSFKGFSSPHFSFGGFQHQYAWNNALSGTTSSRMWEIGQSFNSGNKLFKTKFISKLLNPKTKYLGKSSSNIRIVSEKKGVATLKKQNQKNPQQNTQPNKPRENKQTEKKGQGNAEKKKSHVLTKENLTADSKIVPLERKGFVKFDGVEFRGVRDLSHMKTKDLWEMYKKGKAPKDQSEKPFIGHHHKQIYHREKDSFLVEIPKDNHHIGNKTQHPYGNAKGMGLTKAERTDWIKVRKKFYKERSRQELQKRGLLNE